MFITKKNESFGYNFILSSEETGLIAEPIVIIKDVDRDLFYNGYAWGKNETSISLESDEFGVVEFTTKFEKVGHYKLTFFELKTEQKNAIDVEVVANEYSDTSFPFVIKRHYDLGDILKVVIQRGSDQLYWNGSAFQQVKIECPMIEVNFDHSHEYVFEYSEEETFLIETLMEVAGASAIVEEEITLDFRRGPFEITQRTANNVHVLSSEALMTKENGVLTDSVLKLRDGSFLKDVSVKLVVLKSINGSKAPYVYHETHTDKDGKWRIMLNEDIDTVTNPSQYPAVLVIEKEGFTSLSIQMKPNYFDLKYTSGGPV